MRLSSSDTPCPIDFLGGRSGRARGGRSEQLRDTERQAEHSNAEYRPQPSR